ncbi:MAG TPA: hypothetical protein VFY29_12345, partial [Terriglobia bacterium]|nr:hypothetical protein [Terriglobia bacterium]
DAAGRFDLQGIVPGDYKLISWTDAEPFAFFDPSFIKQADERGQPIRITDSSSVTITVTPIPFGEIDGRPN